MTRWTLRKARAQRKRLNEAATREIHRLRDNEAKWLDGLAASGALPLYAPALKQFSLEDEIALWQHWAGDDIGREIVRDVVESEYGVKATSGPRQC